MRRSNIRTWATMILCLCAADASAGSLARSLLATEGRFVVAAPFVDELERTISRSVDLFATATTPGFTYHYDTELGIYERSSTSLGPAFLQRADTVGKGRFDAGVTYLYANFTELDGDDLDDLERGALFDFVGALDGTEIDFTDFDLTTNAVYFSGTYGVTDRIDASVLLPLFSTAAKTDQIRDSLTFGTQRLDTDDDATGIGDLQLRGKWHFYDATRLKAATGLALRVPTGDEGDFQGIGDVTLTPALVLSRPLGRFDVHGSLGMEVNVNDLEQSRGIYATGVAAAVTGWLTANVDIIGSSQVADEDIDSFVAGRSVGAVEAAAGDVFRGENVSFSAANGGTMVTTTLSRLDVVDLAVGLKVNPIAQAVLYVAAIIPITDDGVRADVVPAIGIEVGF